MVSAVIDGSNNDSRDRVATVLIIVFRYRNNLFHGVKWQYKLADQLGNFHGRECRSHERFSTDTAPWLKDKRRNMEPGGATGGFRENTARKLSRFPRLWPGFGDIPAFSSACPTAASPLSTPSRSLASFRLSETGKTNSQRPQPGPQAGRQLFGMVPLRSGRSDTTLRSAFLFEDLESFQAPRRSGGRPSDGNVVMVCPSAMPSIQRVQHRLLHSRLQVVIRLEDKLARVAEILCNPPECVERIRPGRA